MDLSIYLLDLNFPFIYSKTPHPTPHSIIVITGHNCFNYMIFVMAVEFEDTIDRFRQSKDRQHNDQTEKEEKNKQQSTNDYI